MNKNKEYRQLSFDASADAESRTIEGLIPYNSLSEYMGFWEKLNPGCFSKSISEQQDIRCLIEHDDRKLLARTKNGSLVLEDREDGLHFRLEAPNTTDGNDILVQVREGLVSGCSFGMIVMDERYTIDDGKEVRTIMEARLLEISLILSEPAYPSTIVYTRSLSSAFKEGEEIDEKGQTAIREEIEKLQSLLPVESNHEETEQQEKQEEVKTEEQKQPEPEKEPEGPTEEEQKKAEEEAKRAEEEQKEIDELMKRLEAAQKIIDENS